MALSVQDQPTFPPSQLSERVQAEQYGWDETNQVWRRVAVGSSGGIVVIIEIEPGTVITTGANTAVGIGATVALPVPPAGTRVMTIQNAGPAGTWVRLREAGGASGTGILMPRLGEEVYGGDGSIAAMEVEDVSLAVGGVAVATTIAIQFQRN